MKHMKKKNCIVCQDHFEYGPNGANEDLFCYITCQDHSDELSALKACEVIQVNHSVASF